MSCNARPANFDLGPERCIPHPELPPGALPRKRPVQASPVLVWTASSKFPSSINQLCLEEGNASVRLHLGGHVRLIIVDAGIPAAAAASFKWCEVIDFTV